MIVKYYIVCNTITEGELNIDEKHIIHSHLLTVQSTKNGWLQAMNFLSRYRRNQYEKIMMTKLLAFLALKDSYGADVLTPLTLTPNSSRGVYIASNIVTDNHYIYLISLFHHTISKNLKLLKNSKISTNGDDFYFVAYYDGINEIKLFDPPKSKKEITNISQSINTKYKKLVRDFLDLNGITISERGYYLKDMQIGDTTIRVGLAKEIIESEKIDINILKGLEKYKDTKKIISAGIYVEIK